MLLLGKAAPLLAAQLAALGERLAFVRDLGKRSPPATARCRPAGGTVLLAPACASFDMFDNFEHRGDVFKRKCGALQEREGQHG